MPSKYKTNKRKKQINKKAVILSSIIAVIAVVVVVAIMSTGQNVITDEKVSIADQSSNITVESAADETDSVVKESDFPDDSGVTIVNSEITEEATFYPYQAGDTYMEVIAIRASDGSVRTALNTCQVCNGSGRGYYVQDGDVLVCQNCGNRFTVDQVEVTKGGCNPVPIFDGDKIQDAETITIPDDFMTDNKALFINWKI